MVDLRRASPGGRIVGWGHLLTIIFIVMACALAGGCATVSGNRYSSGIQAEPSARKLLLRASKETNKKIEPLVVGYPESRDPLIGLNRAVFVFNDVLYSYVLIPLSKGYLRVTSDPVRNSVANFFDNIKMPVNAVNHLLQLKPRLLGKDLLRFGINSTIGLLGLFDPAAAWWGFEKKNTDFEATLSHYGSGYGTYIVLPFFGPSDLRNSASIVVDHFLNPIIYLTENPGRTAIVGFDQFQDDAPGAQQYVTLRRKSKDPYVFFRDLYLQGVQRDANY